MATTVADTSFLFSLFGNDAHTPAAKNWVLQAQLPISVTALGRYELGNAFRFAAFRKAISQVDALASLAAFEADLKSGHLQQASGDLKAIVFEAARLSELHTVSGGHRSFDILHVATARLLKATTFLSFDANQRRLATTLRLNVGP
ncbi:MAG: type II toxin-antitoxin system VapC family toxin [Verrucomicrobia bacterium]|nr:type II toxin-antitoxin system VapC family toxin [Verrucomicrobiota bacterium]